MKGGGYGVVVDIVLGILGGIVGGFVFGLLGLHAGGTIGQIIVAFVGAVILVWIARKLKMARKKRTSTKNAVAPQGAGVSGFLLQITSLLSWQKIRPEVASLSKPTGRFKAQPSL